LQKGEPQFVDIVVLLTRSRAAACVVIKVCICGSGKLTVSLERPSFVVVGNIASDGRQHSI